MQLVVDDAEGERAQTCELCLEGACDMQQGERGAKNEQQRVKSGKSESKVLNMLKGLERR